MSREMWSQLKKYEDGESINAETLNIPIGQLGDRTAYLYAKLNELISSGKMSSVIVPGVPLSTDEGLEPEKGNAVYLDGNTGLFARARATMSLYDDFTAANSAFTVGILQSKDGDHGNVLIYGNLNLNPSGSPILKANMIESGEDFRPGRYYLSANEAGKLTANPNGPLIYVCTMAGGVTPTGGLSGNAIVSPQFLDIGTSHVHRTAVLTARPAGTFSTEGYLPLDDSQYDIGDSSGSSGSDSSPAMSRPLALRFGGTWTSDRKVDYSFFIGQETVNWPGPVTLSWTEDGGSEVHTVDIHALDEEVPISNGLTVRLSIGSSDESRSYSGLAADQRKWETLTFPDAGRGWLDHSARAVASGELEGLKVAISGRIWASPSTVNVLFPSTVDVYAMGPIDTLHLPVVGYNGKQYEFTLDGTASGTNIPVPVGTCVADSVLYLAEAMTKNEGADSSSSGGPRFAAYEYANGQAAKLVITDSVSALLIDATPAVADHTDCSGFNVVGGTGICLVVSDGACRILSDTPVVQGVKSYTWVDAGDISLMVYQDVSDPYLAVPAGTLVSAVMTDDDPTAAYDYVLGMDSTIAKYWPPVPARSAALVVNGVEMDNKALVPSNPTVSFGKDTVHWFSREEGKRPWPEAFQSRTAPIDPAYDKTEIMHWVRSFQGATGPVTSLQTKPGSPLKVYGFGTFDSANTGDLEIAADFDFRIENGGAPGFQVPKRTRDGVMLAGPVVERIVGGEGVRVISKAGCPDGQGTVIVALDNGAYSSQFSDIALKNAEQAKIGMFPYIRLRGYSGSSISSPSAFTATMRVPDNLPDGKYRLRVYATVFGEEGFEDEKHEARVKMSYNILPDFRTSANLSYRDLKSTLLRPDTERDVRIPFGHSEGGTIVYHGFDPIIVTTDDGTVSDRDDVISGSLGYSIPSNADFGGQPDVSPELRPGYLVGIRISRAVSDSDSMAPYTSAIGFINLYWAIVSDAGDTGMEMDNGTGILAGVKIRANTPAGMRSAIETIGGALGATIVDGTRR